MLESSQGDSRREACGSYEGPGEDRELKQARRKQRRAMKPCILETVVIRGNVNKYTDRDVKLGTRRRKSVPKEKE